MTWKPAARATLASAASPEVHSTGINVRMRSPPLRISGFRRELPEASRAPQALGEAGSKQAYPSGGANLPLSLGRIPTRAVGSLPAKKGRTRQSPRTDRGAEAD